MNDLNLLVVALVAVVTAATLLFVMRRIRENIADRPPPTPPLPRAAAHDDDLQDLIDRDDRIAAIKLVRERTGWGLKEAKDYVDAFPDVPALHVAAPPPTVADPALEAEVRRLAAQGQSIEAIKLVRERTGWGLREAKDYVDALTRAG